MARRAVFLDRDKTIIVDPGYIDDPELVSLIPGAAESIKQLNEAGYAVVVVTNQSGVARGKVTEEQLAEIHERLREMLLEQGARLDAVYYCPYLDGPEAVVEHYRRDSDLRKPNPGMLLRAAEELDLNLADSWMIGDSERDVEAGSRAGCRTILIRGGGAGHSRDGGTAAVGWALPTSQGGRCPPYPDAEAASLAEAVRLVLERPNLPRKPRPAGATAPPSPGLAGAGSSTLEADKCAAILTEIRDVLKRRERSERYEEFSATRLVGTLAQMLALVAAGWGVLALFSGSDAAAGRLLLAVFLQMLSLSAFRAANR